MSDLTSIGEAVAEAEESEWFTALFASHATAIYRYFARRGPLNDAEDLAADVFATAWRRRSDIPEGHDLAWLYRTASYVLANHRRKTQPLPQNEIDDSGTNSAENDPALLVVSDVEVRTVLAILPTRDREILLLHAWEGLNGQALADALGISRGGADAALSRARSKLRAAWASQLTDPDD